MSLSYLYELRSKSVNDFNSIGIIDTIFVGGNAYDGACSAEIRQYRWRFWTRRTIFPMQFNISFLEMPFVNLLQFPEASEACEEWAGNPPKWCGQSSEDGIEEVKHWQGTKA